MAIIGSRTLGMFRKIDIYAKVPGGLRYLCSTNSARNLREARERAAIASKSYGASDLKAEYAPRR